ncbi:septum formation protein Maf [bacterium]|nr:septum formation protein Maf [bacterium]
MKITLASQSPRRAMLLKQIGLEFNQISCNVDESDAPVDNPVEHVHILSKAKAKAALHQTSEGLIIAADTIVVHDDKILGKPKDEDEARKILHQLSDHSHKVYTGISLIHVNHGELSDVEMTVVNFLHLEDWEIDAYVSSGSPLDKAGAYGIQDRGGLMISDIVGDYNNVVGFPLTLFYYMWRELCGDDVVRSVLNGS